jgi:PTS system nitrogen regulatory IIA component
MSQEMMTIEQLASYLQRDQREVQKWASRGYLPVHKVSGEYRFHPVEINHWLETQMHAYTEQELSKLELGAAERGLEQQPLLSTLVSEATIAVPLLANTKASVLRELIKVAEASWQVYDADKLFEAVREREEMGTTALESGVAIPHPHRPMPNLLGDSIVAIGRTPSGIPFGAPRGGLTDLFFLVCCRDDRTHLRVLARLSRLMLREGFVQELRQAESPAELYQALEAAERDLLN